MKNKITFLAVMCIVAWFTTASPVSAQTKDQSQEYKEALMKILNVSGSTAMTDSMLPQVVRMMKQISPEMDEKAMLEFTSKWQQKITNAVVEAYAPVYQQHMTLKELKQVVDFYESPIGKKYSAVAPECMKQAFPLMQKLGGEMMSDMPQTKVQVKFDTPVKTDKKKSRDQELFDKAYTAPKDSIQLSPREYKRGMSTVPTLYSIERRKNDTKVTFSAPIYFDSQWQYFSPGFKIIDKETGDEYNVRGYDGGAPFDRLMVIKGFNNKCIFISLVFPKLKKSVKEIDILELPHENDKNMLPSNDDGIAKSYFNVKLKDYLVTPKKNKKVYN